MSPRRIIVNGVEITPETILATREHFAQISRDCIAERAAAILDAPQYLVAGEKLWNGAEVSQCLAVAYNRLTDRIEQFKAEGRRVPEALLNGRHNLIAQA